MNDFYLLMAQSFFKFTFVGFAQRRYFSISFMGIRRNDFITDKISYWKRLLKIFDFLAS